MAQIKNNARGFLSSNIQVRDLKEQRGDIHHIFPKKYLQKNGIENKKEYNQIANYVYTQSEINIKIKDEAPCVYINKIKEQINKGENKLCSINKIDDLFEFIVNNGGRVISAIQCFNVSENAIVFMKNIRFLY